MNTKENIRNEEKTLLRKDFIGGRVSYEEYYGQFITDDVFDVVKRGIGEKRIKSSVDKFFNDIPLSMFDKFHQPILRRVQNKLCKANKGGYTLSDTVCIAKEAARKIRGW